MQKSKHVILVAGYDYTGGGVSFETLCLNQMHHLLQKYRDIPLKFTLFSFKEGRVQSTLAPTSDRDFSWVEVQRFRPITLANYTGNVFNRNQDGVMSIMNVYAYIQDLAKNEPRSLLELNIFSHGYIDGPILVNSNDTRPASDPNRDDKDKDGRALKDFRAPNMVSPTLNLFQSAFDPGGRIWIFGCVFDYPSRDVLHQILKSSVYRQTAPGKLKDSVTFQFIFTVEQARNYFLVDTNFFPSTDARGNNPLRFVRDFSKVKAFITRRLNRTYAFHMVKVSKVACYAALPGTYADYEEGKVHVQYPLMVIPKAKPPFDDNFTKYIEFYKSYFYMAEDPEGRGYGIYLP